MKTGKEKNDCNFSEAIANFDKASNWLQSSVNRQEQMPSYFETTERDKKALSVNGSWRHLFPNLIVCAYLSLLSINNYVWIIFMKLDQYRRSHQRCSVKKVFWKYAANLQENTHAQVRFLTLHLCSFIEIALQHGCSPVNLLHVFKTLSLKNTSEGLLLLTVVSH